MIALHKLSYFLFSSHPGYVHSINTNKTDASQSYSEDEVSLGRPSLNGLRNTMNPVRFLSEFSNFKVSAFNPLPRRESWHLHAERHTDEGDALVCGRSG